MRKSFLIPLFLFLTACLHQNRQEDKQKILIEGRSTGLADGMLYLTDALSWKSVLDSAPCRSGSFRFLLEKGHRFAPQDVAIHFFPGNDREHPVRLQFRNHILHDVNPPLQSDHFWLDKDTLIIEGKNHRDALLHIQAGPETDLMMENQLNDIGWIGDKDSLTRARKMARLENAIRQHPGSYFLLESMRRSKEMYSKAELTRLLALFDTPTQQSLPATKLSIALNAWPDKGQPYPLLYFPGTQQPAQPLVDTGRQLNMLVFWASWCKPCRLEIPLLKKLQERYAASGLAITSISIDTAPDRWQQALKEEQMPWRQLIIPADRIESTENIFRFTSIPFLVFTDQRGVEIARFADYEESALERYEALIRARLMRAP